MDTERQQDPRFPLVFGMFFVSCLTGGILLIFWYFDVTGSQPWFQILALVLIGFPWIFWFLGYIYTFIKSCFQRNRISASGGGDFKGDSRRSNNQATKPAVTAAVVNRTSPRDSPVNSPVGKRHVQFGAVVIVEDDHHDVAGESSVASSKECEMPLNLSVSS
ncbi:hypothetical protein U1Q18_023141 [Sarracenia purpurea var. burkii]